MWAARVAMRLLGPFTQKSYQAAKARYQLKLTHADDESSEPPVLVYQMGKVGSQTVTQALKNTDLNRRIYHLHTLTPERIERRERERKPFFPEVDSRLKYVWRCQYVRRRLLHGSGEKKWKVVTLVRDPIARNISAFFEEIEIEPLEVGGQWRITSEEHDFQLLIKDNNVTELIEIFFEKYPHHTPLTYFDRELQAVLGIDLYASPFPTTEGYKIYNGKKADVLLIKLEHINRCAARAFKEFLNIENLTFEEKNVSQQKEYAVLYRSFKETINFDESYLDTMYRSKFARQFYSDAELESFRKRWTRNHSAGRLELVEMDASV